MEWVGFVAGLVAGGVAVSFAYERGWVVAAKSVVDKVEKAVDDLRK